MFELLRCFLSIFSTVNIWITGLLQQTTVPVLNAVIPYRMLETLLPLKMGPIAVHTPIPNKDDLQGT